MPECVTSSVLLNSGRPQSCLHGALYLLLRDMMPARLSGAWIVREFFGWKQVLPQKRFGRVLVFSFEGIWQINLPTTALQLFVVQSLHGIDLNFQGRTQRLR